MSFQEKISEKVLWGTQIMIEDQQTGQEQKDQIKNHLISSLCYHDFSLTDIISKVIERKVRYRGSRDYFRKLSSEIGINIFQVYRKERAVEDYYVGGIDSSYEEFFSDYSGIRLYYVSVGGSLSLYPPSGEYNYIKDEKGLVGRYLFAEEDEMSVVIRACAVMTEFFEAFNLIEKMKECNNHKMGPVLIDGSVKTKITAINQAMTFLRDYFQKVGSDPDFVEDYMVNAGVSPKLSSLYFFYFNFITFLRVFAYLLENYPEYIFFVPKRSSDDDFKTYFRSQIESKEKKDELDSHSIDVKDMEFLYSILDVREYVSVPITSRNYKIKSEIQTKTEEISELIQKIDRLVDSAKVVYIKTGDGLIKKIECWDNGFEIYGDIIYDSFHFGNESIFVRRAEKIAKMIVRSVKSSKQVLSKFSYRAVF
jgi:hypothetical protein